MAANCARRSCIRLTKTSFNIKPPSSLPSNASKFSGFASTKPASRSFFPRRPVELGGALSLMPFHSVTASVLLNSMLSSETWGWLSEEFATPL